MIDRTSSNLETIRWLPWDSEFFGLKTGKLDLQQSELIGLPSVLHRAVKDGYELLYLTVPDDVSIDDATVSTWGGRLVDRRVGYKMILRSNQTGIVETDSQNHGYIKITEYPTGSAKSDLKQLAVLAGGLSRFVKDTRIDPSKAKRLFEIWIEKSALGVNGEKVFVAIGNNKMLAGFATIGTTGDSARIGLIAVNPENQGQGVGKSLLAALKIFALGQGICEIKVATQADNIAANQLYRRACFVLDNSEKIYHFMLRQPPA